MFVELGSTLDGLLQPEPRSSGGDQVTHFVYTMQCVCVKNIKSRLFNFIFFTYSSLHLVVERMEELMEGTSLEESGWFQRERSFKLPVLCRGMVGFGQRRIFGTVGKEHPSPPLPSPAVGEVLKPLELQLDGLNCF